MSNNTIYRTLVWSGKLRFAHWALTLSTLVLMATGWLIPAAPSIVEITRDWHYLAAAIFTTALVLRLWLLVNDKRSAGIIALMPRKKSVSGMAQMLRFYITLGKAPLPAWFAHNPLWAPIYLFAILIMLLLAATGVLMHEHPALFNIYLPDLHTGLAGILSAFTLLHVISVFMHDAKGTGSDISAMVNGHRIFVVQKTDKKKAGTVQHVSLDDFGKQH